MAAKGAINSKFLATLALAKSIVERDARAAKSALTAGADVEAFWLDGQTRLRELALGREFGSEAMAQVFTPKAPKNLLPMRDDPARWNFDFVSFAAARGHNFSRETRPFSGQTGTELAGWATAKGAVSFIDKKWSLLEDASARDERDGKSSRWSLSFEAQWDQDRRIVGFNVNFYVDAPRWNVVELFEETKARGKETDWPDALDPLIAPQKTWEGGIVAWKLLGDYFDLDGLIAALRKGCDPFYEFEGHLIGEPMEANKAPEQTRPFMRELRAALGTQDGWHLRIAPWLTESGIATLRAKADLKSSTPEAKVKRKALKDRTDIM